MRILAIAVDLGLLDTVADLLGARGHVVLRAGSAAEAARLTEAQRPDLVLFDFELAGADTARALRTERATAGVPIVALTPIAPRNLEALIGAGCVGYVAKPLDPRNFGALVEPFARVRPPRRPVSGSA